MSSPHSQWLGDAEPKPAPDPLRRIQALVNSIEMPEGADQLADPSQARRWLETNDLLGTGAELDPDDLALVRGVREGLRAMLVQNAGGPPPSADALAPLREVAARGSARTGVGEQGEILLSGADDSVSAKLVELLLIIRDAQRGGIWTRLKACGNDECQWAFYDRSRNHGGTWCDMSSCGNKLKNREFRARKRSGRSH